MPIPRLLEGNRSFGLVPEVPGSLRCPDGCAFACGISCNTIAESLSQIVAHNRGLHSDDIIVHLEGEQIDYCHHKRHVLLADIVSTAVFELNITYRHPNDIQNLFRIFVDEDNSENLVFNQRAFGFGTFSELKMLFPDKESHRTVLHDRTKNIRFMPLRQTENEVKIRGIVISDLWRDLDLRTTYINWKAVSQLDRLQDLVMPHCGIIGNVAFDQLPRDLHVLNLFQNPGLVKFSGAYRAPLHLYVDLMGTGIEKNVKIGMFPRNWKGKLSV